MENEWKNLDLAWCSKQIYSAQTHWVAENVEGFDQVIKKMLKIIEDGNASDDGSRINCSKRNQLIALLEEINLKHQLLAEQCDHMVDDLHMSSKTQKEKFVAMCEQAGQDSSWLTPDQKLVLQKNERQAVALDFPLSSGGSSFINSGKEGSESSALVSSDSDSESYNSSPNKGFTPSSVEIPNGKFVDMETGITGVEQVGMTNGELANSLPNVRETQAYNLMLLKITKYEEDLRASKRQLLSSKQEVTRLHSDLKSALVAMDDLEAKLEKGKNEVKMREEDLDLEKGNVSELRMQVAILETEVLDSSYKIGKLEQEKEANTAKLESSEGKLAELKHKITERDYEIKKLNVALQDALRDSEIEKAEFQSQNSRLSENLTLLEAKLTEREEQIRILANELKKCETSKIEMKSSYEAQEIRWQGDIEGLNAQLIEKLELEESLHKAQDGLKLKYDELIADRDGLNAKAQALGAELCAAEYNIQQMESQLHQLQVQNAELIAGSETLLKLRDELGLKAEKLEREVEKQAALIEDRGEEKREAIRQLCFSLEHYRSGYNELRQACIRQMRHAVIAS